MNPWAVLIDPPLPGVWYGTREVHRLGDEPPASAPEAQPPFQPWALLRAGQPNPPGPYWPLLGVRQC
jgi:hypothetical protein